MGRVVAAAVYNQGKRIADIALHEAQSWASKPDHLVWIGLQEPSVEELACLKRQFGLHELAVEDALAQHPRPKLETFGDALFLVVYSPVPDHERLEFAETQIFAGNGYVISARYGASASYSQVRRHCEARPLLLAHGEDFVLYALLHFIVENYRPVIGEMHGELERAETGVLTHAPSHAEIERIHGLRRDVLRLHRYIAPMVEICHDLQNLEFPFIDPNIRPYFRDVAIHANRLLQDLNTLRDIGSYTIEMGLLLEASRQSVVQRKFAAWAALLAFPTAVAGIYGMNFRYMPELAWHYGYYGALAFIGFGCAAFYANFKRLGWL
ncbi:magnesium and cobalt transport protein CorA [Nannocystis punicea]|uniref:Magnesium and cobalt transport protein CorA n=1 Tax=Nannocystis punicea TaxID=2995304 RepID=A0ABY7GYA6_9BACT|nr:magnesium and cobalt transport protein CorA [Nannocystis poenicansa]WAS91892.1 magnesium and cobalt transport protein CorA [Nannocystis poenicansa]